MTPYVPDLDHFRGSYGAKNVMPLHRDAGGNEPNVADGLLEALSARLATEVAAEDLLAYVYSLGATAAFTDRFNEELAEAAGPIHIPITADPDLFWRAVALGRDLLWWHTWGERFAPDGERRLPEGREPGKIRVVDGMPNDFDYDPESQTLTVGTGTVAPVSQEAWDFEVSGLRGPPFLARLPHEEPQGPKVKPPGRHTARPLDPVQGTTARPVHHRAHNRSHPQSRHPPRQDRQGSGWSQLPIYQPPRPPTANPRSHPFANRASSNTVNGARNSAALVHQPLVAETATPTTRHHSQ